MNEIYYKVNLSLSIKYTYVNNTYLQYLQLPIFMKQRTFKNKVIVIFHFQTAKDI